MRELKQAVILAGGRGKRLIPITDKLPKPMAPVNGKPFLDYLLDTLIKEGIKEIILLTGYKANIIEERYKNYNDIVFKYSRGKVEDRTGRRLLNSFHLLDDNFLLLYGDNYWPLELNKMTNFFIKKKCKISTTVFSNINGTGEYGYENNVVVDKDGFVIKYDKQRKSKMANGVDIGYFIISKEALNPNIQGNLSFEEDMLPYFLNNKNLAAYSTDNQYYYITNERTLSCFAKKAKQKVYNLLPSKYININNK